MSEALKPCGSCGSDENKVGVLDDYGVAYWVECAACGACTGQHDTCDAAIAAWNRRTVTREQVEDVAVALRGHALGYFDGEPLAEHSRSLFLKRAASALRAAGFKVPSCD